MSEQSVQMMLNGWNRQQSFLTGRPARYGVTDSVRPDYSHPTLNIHVDVKNYDLRNSGNRANLYRDVGSQARERASHFELFQPKWHKPPSPIGYEFPPLTTPTFF